MKLNSKRKNVIVGCLILFLISVVYLPTEMKIDEFVTHFLGYEFIWDIFLTLQLKLCLLSGLQLE